MKTFPVPHLRCETAKTVTNPCTFTEVFKEIRIYHPFLKPLCSQNLMYLPTLLLFLSYSKDMKALALFS